MVAHTVYLAVGCSSVEVARNVVVTAKHCLPDDAKAEDAFESPEGGTVFYVSPDKDFAVLVYPGHPMFFLDRGWLGTDYIGMRDGAFGEHIYVVGYPTQLGSNKQRLTITDGLVAGPIDEDGQWRITAPVYFGNSGGGVWSEGGALVGIAVSIFAADVGSRYPLPYPGQAFMVPISEVMPHLPIPQ